MTPLCKVDVTLPGVRGASGVHGAGSVDALLSEVSRMGSGLARSGRPPETPRSNGPLSSQMADGDVAIELHAQPLHGPQLYS